jgi:hypothetical protein
MRHAWSWLLAVACSAPTAPSKAPASPGPVDPSGSVASAGPGSAAPPPASEVSLEQLAPGQVVRGFSPRAVYLDGADHPIGARMVHVKTGFTLDYLRIESAPQGLLWVTTYPTSDKGEPHTQEHLLLGKGNSGRKLASFSAMALVESGAFTGPRNTCYHFHTVAGHEVFWPVFEAELDATLNPDYTDEEIRREVRNFGVDRAANGALRLEEKGSVYNEMVRDYESGDTVLWRLIAQLVYGAQHPLALESGGYPAAIRTMTTADVRRFHDATYHLANMGMVGAFPSSMPLASVLDHTAALLDRSAGRTGRVFGEADLPRPAGAPPGTIEVAEFPHGDAASPGAMALAWPATRSLDLTEETLLELFVAAFAGDESTPLYKKLIDSKSRVMDLGANRLLALVREQQGEPVTIALEGVAADKLDASTIRRVRGEVAAELTRLAQLPDGDPALLAFNHGVLSRVTDLRRQLARFVDSPPGFGFRGTIPAWLPQLQQLERASGFRKSLTLRPELAAIERLLAAPGNPWRQRLRAWGLLDTPYGVAVRPSPALRARTDAERGQRIEAELARLGQVYGTRGGATLARYEAEYGRQTRVIEQAAKATPLPPLIDAPPMTLDDALAFDTRPIDGVPAFRATIGSMQSARVELAFRLDAVPEADLMYLALLPDLMSQVGVVDGGTVIASDQMRDRLRKEILELDVHYVSVPRSQRVELVVAGAGNDAAEMHLALGWMARAMTAADWRPDNLQRLRDVVDQAVTALRQTMQESEEGWVRDPHDAWWQQASPLHLHTSSFLTRAHDLHRLRWQLLDPGDAKLMAEVTGFLDGLAAASLLPRAQLAQLAQLAPAPGGPVAPAIRRWAEALHRLSPAAGALAGKALADLKALLPELPDGSLAADWAYLCKQMAHDLGVGAPAALDHLRAVRDAIVAAGNARVVAVGSPASQAALAADLAALVGKLDRAPRARQTYPALQPIAARLRDHDRAVGETRYVALVNSSTSSGVFLNSAPATGLTDTSDDALLDYLASNTFGGHGAHSLAMKTWEAGLAYSNGVHPLVHDGEIEYYAERCPRLTQTLSFVIAQLRAAEIDVNIARYAVAGAFDSRIAASYEQRAEEMAGDFADGVTPDVVKAFRGRLLALAGRDGLVATLAARMPKVYGRVMPGYGPPVPGGVYFVIGPEPQLTAYQDYLRAAVGTSAVLHRLYPRDFWIPARLRPPTAADLTR